MKTSLLRISIFSATLAIGISATWLFLFRQNTSELKQYRSERITEENAKTQMAVTSDDFVPEFTDIDIPELPELSLNHADLRTCTADRGRRWLALFKVKDRYFLENRRIAL